MLYSTVSFCVVVDVMCLMRCKMKIVIDEEFDAEIVIKEVKESGDPLLKNMITGTINKLHGWKLQKSRILIWKKNN